MLNPFFICTSCKKVTLNRMGCEYCECFCFPLPENEFLIINRIKKRNKICHWNIYVDIERNEFLVVSNNVCELFVENKYYKFKNIAN